MSAISPKAHPFGLSSSGSVVYHRANPYRVVLPRAICGARLARTFQADHIPPLLRLCGRCARLSVTK